MQKYHPLDFKPRVSKHFRMGFFVAVAVMLAQWEAGAQTQAVVELGAAQSFAVLAGAGITITGPTTITGDIGTYPTPSITGIGSLTLNGVNHADDLVQRGSDQSRGINHDLGPIHHGQQYLRPAAHQFRDYGAAGGHQSADRASPNQSGDFFVTNDLPRKCGLGGR